MVGIKVILMVRYKMMLLSTETLSLASFIRSERRKDNE